ncbi:MAG: hypothetical protein K9M13_02970 [Simkaniaceae bacterium]|nr:hypothetical protein [Simkaniaceae bacterium]
MSYYLSSMLHLFVVLSTFCLSALFIALSFAPQLRFFCYEFLSERADDLTYIGTAIGVYGLLLLLVFSFLYRKSYITLKMKACEIKIDESLIKSYVQEYWRKALQNPKAQIQIVIHADSHIEVVAPLEDVDFQDDQMILQLERELGQLLAQRLGYQKKFLLTLGH